ncbi:unnamed protein product [Schistosoma turkestanicum]|nr:unnamed protein product [Schistosoma turkestanicum]
MFVALWVLIFACLNLNVCNSLDPVTSPATFQFGSNESSILLQSYINVTLSYSEAKNQPIIISINSTNEEEFNVSGSFGEELEILQLSWLPNGSNKTWNLTFQFVKSDSSYNLNEIKLEYQLSNSSVLRNASNNQSLFSAAVGSYYSCQAEQNISLDQSGPSPVTVNLTLSQFKVQAFRDGEETEFTGLNLLCTVLALTNDGHLLFIRFTISNHYIEIIFVIRLTYVQHNLHGI